MYGLFGCWAPGTQFLWTGVLTRPEQQAHSVLLFSLCSSCPISRPIVPVYVKLVLLQFPFDYAATDMTTLP